MFAGIKGNDDVKRALTGMLDSGRVPHAIIFHEEDGGGAFAFCQAFLEYLYCRDRNQSDSCGSCPNCNKISKLIHPDVHYVFPTVSSAISLNYIEKFRDLAKKRPYFTESELLSFYGEDRKSTLISVKESNAMLETLSLSALEGGYRSVVIYLPEKMNTVAANKLLKMIEEPPLKTQFLLITHHGERILQTISSRCQHIRIKRSSDNPSDVVFAQPELFAELMDRLSAKKLLPCIELAETLASLPSRELAKDFCKFATYRLRQVFVAQQGLEFSGPVPEDAGRWASVFPKSFCRKAMPLFDKALSLIDRNVNMKILFTELVSSLYLII